MISDYFASVWTNEPEGIVPELPSINVRHPMMDVIVSPKLVEEKLMELNVNKATGPDEVHPRLLKEAAVELSLPLSIIFKQSLHESKLPSNWKMSVIIVLFKKGMKALASNYRPVSLTSIICKVMESILQDHFTQHMLRNELFTNTVWFHSWQIVYVAIIEGDG